MNNKLTQYLLYQNYYKNISDSKLKQIQVVDGLFGRIIRGTKPSDADTLTDDPNRKIVMLIDQDGLHKIINKTGYESLLEVEWEADYIKRKVDEGCWFKLVIFSGGMAQLADWDGMTNMVSFMYPDIESDLRKSLPELKSIPFEKLEGTFGVKFAEVDKIGDSNPNFMTYDRFLKSSRDVAACRAFFYFTVHLREKYKGTGFAGKVKEYGMPNVLIENLGDHAVLDIEVVLP